MYNVLWLVKLKILWVEKSNVVNTLFYNKNNNS